MLEWFDLVWAIEASVSLMTTMVLSYPVHFALLRSSLASGLLLLSFYHDVSYRGSSLVGPIWGS